MRFPEGEGCPCITAVEDDSQPLLTIDVTDGKNQAILTLTEAQRTQVAYEGFTPLLPRFQH